MNERQLKVIRQRLACGLVTPADVMSVADEVVRLRAGLDLLNSQWDDFMSLPNPFEPIRNTIRSLLEG